MIKLYHGSNTKVERPDLKHSKPFRVVLKILDLSFFLFLCSLFRPLFVSFGVILSSFISHIARYAPSSSYKSTHENRTKINST